MTRALEIINNYTDVQDKSAPMRNLLVAMVEPFVEDLFTNPEMLLHDIERYPETLKYIKKQLNKRK